jgi:hypothetical protein
MQCLGKSIIDKKALVLQYCFPNKWGSVASSIWKMFQHHIRQHIKSNMPPNNKKVVRYHDSKFSADRLSLENIQIVFPIENSYLGCNVLPL